MNKRPVCYMQTDPTWARLPYRVPGEQSTIGDSGCGPSCAAMLIETLTGKKYTPFDACDWSVRHGYKALHQGTYYSYFTPQFRAFGIDCQMLDWENTYGRPDHPNHQKVLNKLKEGYYVIACMGPGLWTRSGHFVVLWWADNKMRINDPASLRDVRLNGDPRQFMSQVKYYWLVDARRYNMTPDKSFKEQFDEMRTDLQDNDAWSGSQEARDWAVKHGIVKGSTSGEFNGMWQDFMTREQFVLMLYRYDQYRFGATSGDGQ